MDGGGRRGGEGRGVAWQMMGMGACLAHDGRGGTTQANKVCLHTDIRYGMLRHGISSQRERIEGGRSTITKVA